MAYKASVGVGCGKYSYTISSETRQCGIDPSFLEGTTMVPWNVDYAKQAIDEFCTDTKDNFLVDPATPQPPPPPTTFTQGKGSYPSQIYRYGDNRTHDTSIFVQFSQNAKNGCSQSEKFLISDHSDRCSKLLTQVLEDPGPCKLSNVLSRRIDWTCRLTRSSIRSWQYRRQRQGKGSGLWLRHMADVSIFGRVGEQLQDGLLHFSREVKVGSSRNSVIIDSGIE